MRTFAIVVVLFALVIFAALVGMAVCYVDEPNQVPAIAKYYLSSMNGILAANLGAIVGIGALLGFGALTAPIDWLQWAGAVLYAVAIVVMTIAWSTTGFTEDAALVVTSVPEIARSGIGLFVAIVGAVLGVNAFWGRITALNLDPTKPIIPDWIVYLLVGLAFFLFLVAFGFAWWFTIQGTANRMPGIAGHFLSGMNGVLAANLGAIVGIGVLAALRAPSLKIGLLHWISAVVYGGAIILAIVAWGLTSPSFTEESEKVVAIIPEITRTGIGLLLAITGAALGVKGFMTGRALKLEQTH